MLKNPSLFVIEIPEEKKRQKIYFPSIYLTQHIEKSAQHLECNQASDGIILDSRLAATRLSSTEHQTRSCANYRSHGLRTLLSPWWNRWLRERDKVTYICFWGKNSRGGKASEAAPLCMSKGGEASSSSSIMNGKQTPALNCQLTSSCYQKAVNYYKTTLMPGSLFPSLSTRLHWSTMFYYSRGQGKLILTKS